MIEVGEEKIRIYRERDRGTRDKGRGRWKLGEKRRYFEQQVRRCEWNGKGVVEEICD